MDQQLLGRFLEVYPFQPATAIWRAPEIAELQRMRFPSGIGLDLGCGDGRLTRVLAEQVGGMRLVGLDPDPLETALARDENLYERLHTCSAEHIPEPDASFDFVLSVSVMEHIPNLREVLREVSRVLKAGGQLIATIPSPGFHSCLRGPLLPGASRDEYLRMIDRRLAHLRYWTTVEWKTELAGAGLNLVQARPIISRADIRRWEAIARMTSGILHGLMRRKPPIEIQRSLGLRRPGARLSPSIAAGLARVLSLGLDEVRPTDEGASGCLLIVAAGRT